jgi:hypothetical protein
MTISHHSFMYTRSRYPEHATRWQNVHTVTNLFANNQVLLWSGKLKNAYINLHQSTLCTQLIFRTDQCKLRETLCSRS